MVTREKIKREAGGRSDYCLHGKVMIGLQKYMDRGLI